MDQSLNKTEPEESSNLAILMDVQLPVSIRFGETEMILEEVVKLGVGSVIELNSGIDQPVDHRENQARADLDRGHAVQRLQGNGGITSRVRDGIEEFGVTDLRNVFEADFNNGPHVCGCR